MSNRALAPARPPASRAALPQGEVSVEHRRSPSPGVHEFRDEINTDRYELSVALFRGRSTVVSNGVVLHDGPVFPGMMRLASPGDRIAGRVYTAWDEVTLRVPVPVLRAALRRAACGWDDRPGARFRAAPLLQPNVQVEQLGRMAVHAAQFEPAHAGLLVHGILEALLAILLRHDGGRTPLREGRFGPEEFRRAAEFAEARLGRQLSLEEWAGALGMPAPEFTRRFRAATGGSPYDWFLGRRVERAKELLRTGDATLCSVALEVGFCSQSHFTEAFRRRVGVPPARWRRERGGREFAEPDKRRIVEEGRRASA